MSVAFIVMAHTAPQQVVRLIERLDRGPNESRFFVHVDRKAPVPIHRAIEDGLRAMGNVRFLPTRSVTWGHWSQVQVSLAGLAAIEESGFDPDQSVLVTGQHYPIKSPEAILDRLGDPERAFLQVSPLPNNEWWPTQHGGLDRIERVWVWLPRRGPVKAPLVRRSLPPRYEPWGGSAYWSLGRPHRRHVLEVAKTDRALRRCFRHSGSGDEVFFQTILMSSTLRDSVVSDSLVFAIWPPGANNPEVLTRKDLDALERTDKLFARKFDQSVDGEVLDLVDARLLR